MTISLDEQRPETTFLPPDMSPEAWEAFLASLTASKRATVARQDAFLSGFASKGSIRSSAPGMGLSRQLVYYWIAEDSYHFKSRLEHACHSFRERLQDIALSRIEEPQGNRGSDVLLMATLNAHWPEKYRRDSIIVNVDVAKDVLAEVRKLTAQRLAAAVTVEPGPATVAERVAGMLGPGENST